MSIIIGTSADNVVTGTGSGDLILAGNGDDTVNAGSGSDLVDGGNGSDTINGGDGGDLIGGGNGTDTLNGDAGDDVLDGGNGDDVLNGGSGSDIVLGGRGDDVVIHVAAENAGEFNIYDGGQGDDTLRLVVSASLNSSAAFQSDLAQFQDMIAQFGSATGFFDSLNIWISSFENIEVVVEGGGNQPPTTAPVPLVAIAEDSGPRLITQAELLVNAADPDSPTLSAVNLQIASGGGTLVSNGDGTWTYTPAANDDGAVSFTYEVTDGSSSVAGTATLLNSDQITFGSPAASGHVLLNASDPDFDFISVSGLAAGTTNAPLTGNIGFAVAGTYGALTISPNGIWGYQLDNNNPNTNALAEGQAVTDVFTYTVIDGHGGSANETITINVTGSNDAPVVSAPLKLEVLEGSSSHQLDLLGRASDADGDAIQVASLNIPEGMTSFVSVAADGHTLTFDTNSPDFNILPIGQFSDFVVGYDLVDSHGSVSHQMATFRLVGTDDAPTVFVQNGNAVIEAGGSDPGVAQSQAIITYSDPDVIGTAPNGAPLFQFVAPDTSGWTQNPNGTWSMVGVYGTATWNYGILTYQLDNNDPDTLALGSEDNVYDTFTLTYTDGTLSTSRDVSFEVVGRSDMYGRLVHWEVYFPTKEHSVADDPLWMLDFPQYTTGVSADLVVGDQIELSGDFADADSDLTRDSVITVWDHNGVYAVPKNVLFDIHGHPHVFEGELFNGYLLSGLPTIQSVDLVIPPPGTVPRIEIGSDQQSLWVETHTGEYPDGLDYYIGDQFVYTITFAPGTPINAPAVNPAPVDVGATNQSIGQTVTIYDGFTLDLNVAYSGTVHFQGPAGTLKFEDTDFSGTVDNFVTNADFLDFSAITQGNATIVGEFSGTELAAHSIGWVTNGTDTTVYVNASDQSEALIDADMAIPLLNVSELHNQDLIV